MRADPRWDLPGVPHLPDRSGVGGIAVYYRIRHLTRFRYSAPVSEILMEVRMHPRTEAQQRCLDYQLTITPKASVDTYRDFLGNSIHHFDVPALNQSLQIMAESVVEMKSWPAMPRSLSPGAW